ncbi:MAG: response regulator transcription factor [Ignavibacteriae bacterium]|nr:response regulator transcription factor [Ignavibacteriota bacterium]
MKPLRIVVADDNEMFQDLIARFLNDHEDVKVVSVVGTGDETLKAVEQHRPEIVVVDLNMPYDGSVMTPRAVKQQYPDTRVFICSAYPDDALETSVIQLGVDGYISKAALKAGLREMVRKVREGK